MSKCEICGEPMPPGEEMFKFHGYSSQCPKPPLPIPPTVNWKERAEAAEQRVAALESGYARELSIHAELQQKLTGYKEAFQREHAMRLLEAQIKAAPEPLYVVFDGPPSHDAGRFVEVETIDGKGVSVGKWEEQVDGLWRLGPFYASPTAPEQEPKP
jgi:hypothetical protein